MNILEDTATRTALVRVSDLACVRSIPLDDDVIAGIDQFGSLAYVELLATTRFGTPFDLAAAERAVAWAREQLELGTAS
jgi:hypothetical protein